MARMAGSGAKSVTDLHTLEAHPIEHAKQAVLTTILDCKLYSLFQQRHSRWAKWRWCLKCQVLPLTPIIPVLLEVTTIRVEVGTKSPSKRSQLPGSI